MNSNRGTLSNSAALPLEIAPRQIQLEHDHLQSGMFDRLLIRLIQ